MSEDIQSRLAVITMLLAAYNAQREAAVIAVYVELTRDIPLGVLRQAARIVVREEQIMTNPVPMLLKAAKRVNAITAQDVDPLASLPAQSEVANPKEGKALVDRLLSKVRSKRAGA